MSVLARISSALGLTKRASLPARDRGRVVQDLSIWQQGGRIGGGLTPRDVSNIIRMADSGYILPLMDLANECRQKDCHLHAVLSVSEEAISGLSWQVVVPEDARAKDKKAAKWVEDVLRSNASFSRLLAYLVGGVYYGFDANEIVWRKDGGDLIPDDFVHLSHRRFGFRPSDGRLVLRDIGMPIEGIDFREQWPNKFIVTQPRVNGDAPHREGLARLLVWATLFRTWTVADWLKTAELSWKPWRIGTYKKSGSNTEDRDDLEVVLDQLSTNGWAAMADTSSIKIEWPGGSTTTKATHSELVNVLGMEMSKAVLGSTETVQSSSSSGYGQAAVHERGWQAKRESRAKQVASDITRDLIGPMVALNRGDVICPQLVIITDDAPNLELFGKAMASLTKSGLRIPAKWARNEGGIPEPEADEETIGGVPPVDPNATPADAPTDQSPPADGGTDGTKPGDKKPKKQPKS